jgi:sigma-B regulation protein RsbU (phosphoserine phosphatase)
MKILIADDEPMSLEMISSALAGMGHQVVVAEDGRKAWAVIQTQEDIQVLVSDWVMPEMDGLELCRHVRTLRRPHYTYVILLTQLKGKENYLKGMEAGADDFTSKPFDRDTMEARLVVAERIIELRYEVAQLERLLPICSYCKKIRDEDDRWMPVEHYMNSKTGADFTHGICPTCYDTTVNAELSEMNNPRKK